MGTSPAFKAILCPRSLRRKVIKLVAIRAFDSRLMEAFHCPVRAGAELIDPASDV